MSTTPWSWRQATDVQRVEAYTRWTLLTLLWALAGLLVVPLFSGDGPSVFVRATLALSGLAHVAACTRLLLLAQRIYPRPGPVPRSALVLPLATSGVLAATLLLPGAEDAGPVVAWILGSGTVWSYSALTDRRVFLPVLAGTALLCWLLAGAVPWMAAYAVAVTAFLWFTVRSTMWLLGVVRELESSRDAAQRLAVAEERLRFSRDVHDVLGRHLAAISVKADLAATLVGRSEPEAAVEQLGEVQSLSRDALREARELARGYRAPSLDRELAGARGLLEAAGIRAEVSLDEVPPAWAERVAWVVREGVTNALRHAEPTRVSIRYDAGRLTVHNDGVRQHRTDVDATGRPGQGLVGLRERLADSGATLHDRRHDDGFTLELVLPARTENR